MSETTSIAISADSGHPYNVIIGSDLLPRLGQWLTPLLVRRHITIIADPSALGAQGEKLRDAIRLADLDATIIETPTIGEKIKTFAVLEEICNALLDKGVERDDMVLSFGGGAVGDVTGLAASLLKRGMRCAHIPTTLLAQTDSAIGGKTGINTHHGKNMIGSFHQPSLVVVDTSLTATLPAREFLGGYAEIVKYGIIKDGEFFHWLEENGARVIAREPDALRYAIEMSCRIKADIVSKDEKEKGERALLNFGHSFGHALETLSAHQYHHGEAVAIGMVMAATLSAKLGLVEAVVVQRIAAHLRQVGLPVKADCLQTRDQTKNLMEIMRQDKKNKRGQYVLILMRAIGNTFISDQVTATDLCHFLNEAAS